MINNPEFLFDFIVANMFNKKQRTKTSDDVKLILNVMLFEGNNFTLFTNQYKGLLY